MKNTSPQDIVSEVHSRNKVQKEPQRTMSEWQKELEKDRPHDEGKTIDEIALETNMSPKTIYDIVTKGVAEGRYIAGKCYRLSPSGRRMQVLNVYRINKKGKK
jgi:hypothetical protein